MNELLSWFICIHLSCSALHISRLARSYGFLYVWHLNFCTELYPGCLYHAVEEGDCSPTRELLGRGEPCTSCSVNARGMNECLLPGVTASLHPAPQYWAILISLREASKLPESSISLLWERTACQWAPLILVIE